MEMLSWVSIHTRSITAWASISSAWLMRPTSLAKQIFSAWKALHAYFSISAVRMSQATKGPGNLPNSCRSCCTARSDSAPITVNGGAS